MADESEKKYVVRQGDCLSSIAAQRGYFWETIWNYGANSELKNLRKDPNILYPGDVLVIPPFDPGEEPSCENEKKHVFVVKGAPAKLHLRFLEDGQPRSNEKYVLKIDGRFENASLDDDGRIEAVIPPTARRVEITFEDEEPILLKLGTLDPIKEVSGVQGRLNNLGFNPGPIDNKFGPRTRFALQRFQNIHKLEITEEIDDATRNKLVEEHGS